MERWWVLVHSKPGATSISMALPFQSTSATGMALNTLRRKLDEDMLGNPPTTPNPHPTNI
jgi:hypothetical protein